MAVTLKDIAARADVSLSTVSRVLRSQPGTSAKSRSAVHHALRTLGLSPGDGAGLLPAAALAPRPIAVVAPPVPWYDMDPWGELTKALSAQIYARGGVAIRASTYDNATAPESLGQRLAHYRTTGAIVLGDSGMDREVSRLVADGIRVLRIATTQGPEAGRLVADLDLGIDIAVRHLVHLGHRRLGLCVGEAAPGGARIAAFRRAAARRLHIEATRSQAPVARSGPGVEAAVHAADSLLQANVTAIIACGPALSLGVIESMRRNHLTIPGQLALLSVGELADAEMLTPPVSQVTLNWPNVASQALDLLIDSPGALPSMTVIPDLVLRSSTQRAASR